MAPKKPAPKAVVAPTADVARANAAKADAARAAKAPTPAPKKTSTPAPKKTSTTSKQDAAMASRAPTPAPKLTAAEVSGMRYAAQAAAQYAASTATKTTTSSGDTKPKDTKPKDSKPDDTTPDDTTDVTETVEGKTRVIRTPVVDSKGKIIGYTVTTYNADGSVASTEFESAGSSEEDEGIKDSTRDAFAALTDLFASYGLESLADEISGYMTSGLTAAEALIKLKTNPTGAYAKRFAGNFARVKNGLNAISEAAYIGLENSYAETLKAYGLGNMINVNRDENYKTFANYIANDMSAVEFKDRIDTVVTRVQNSDPGIKATLKSFYPTITDNDLISYFLNPTENLLKLKEKVTASEIGAAALGNNLSTNVTTATDLARFGIDQKAAREGYSTIAGILPTSTKLSDIYSQSGIRYAQAEGEAEVFKGSQDAATKRTRLASMERGSFSGSSGRLQTQNKSSGLI